MNLKMLKPLLFLLFLTGIIGTSNAQVQHDLSEFRNAIKFEGKRYLMNELYELSSEEFEPINTKLILSDINSGFGFMFVMITYEFKENKGVVITIFDENASRSKGFMNFHLTGEEFLDLSKAFYSSDLNENFGNKQMVKRFNDKIVLELDNKKGFNYYIWLDNYYPYRFKKNKWEKKIFDRVFLNFNKTDQ